MRDDKLQAEVGIYPGLMEDFEELANIFIGNQVIGEFTDDGEYDPLLLLVSQFHFSPENDRLHYQLLGKINLIEKKILKLRAQIDSNHKKAKYIYRNR